MAVPKKRTSHTKKQMRRAHDALSRVSLVNCPNCGEAKERHRMCPSCHFYKGKQVDELQG
ncbi:MAG: 50S ribosomal protein L32 [Bdellovibrionales bacterium]|nr:50S ribosomal protein L32 [Bdellovibrionales bacterium]